MLRHHATRLGWKAARFFGKSSVYLVSGFSAMYCTARFVGSIGKCEDVSMVPTIQNGDVVLISPLPVAYNRLKKGDVVFCKQPRNARTVICKRMVAMEGDTVFNNEKGYEEYLERGHVWLQGDNKEQSIDSRRYGQVPYGLIISKVMLKIWPPNRIGFLGLPEEDELLQKEKDEPNLLK